MRNATLEMRSPKREGRMGEGKMEARNLVPAKSEEKADSSGKPRPRNDTLSFQGAAKGRSHKQRPQGLQGLLRGGRCCDPPGATRRDWVPGHRRGSRSAARGG